LEELPSAILEHPSEFEVPAEESEIDSWAQSQGTIGRLEDFIWKKMTVIASFVGRR
jgi:hypothetical protein